MSESALAVQVGGNHYKNMPIQPVDFCLVHGFNTCQSNIVKYVCRYRDKGGAADLKKAIHYCDLWVDLARERGLLWAEWALKPRGGVCPIEEFIAVNQLLPGVAFVVKSVCWLPTSARVKVARAMVLDLLMNEYGEVA